MTEEDDLVKEVMDQAQSEEGVRLADEAFSRLKACYSPEKACDLQEQDIMRVLKVSYIAERFFGRSRSWIYQKLNHNIKNGKPDDFTEEERKKLKLALNTIAYEIQIMSDNL